MGSPESCHLIGVISFCIHFVTETFVCCWVLAGLHNELIQISCIDCDTVYWQCGTTLYMYWANTSFQCRRISERPYREGMSYIFRLKTHALYHCTALCNCDKSHSRESVPWDPVSSSQRLLRFQLQMVWRSNAPSHPLIKLDSPLPDTRLHLKVEFKGNCSPKKKKLILNVVSTQYFVFTAYRY